jgi:predicted enzyme related to lactoylglutathione lyase
VEILSSRVLLHPQDFERSEHFYRTALGLGVFREFGNADFRGVVFFIGGGLLELSGHSSDPPATSVELLLQVRDLTETHRHLEQQGVKVIRGPQREPWGLDELWIQDPDGVRIVVLEIPEDHPLRRDTR